MSSLETWTRVTNTSLDDMLEKPVQRIHIYANVLKLERHLGRTRGNQRKLFEKVGHREKVYNSISQQVVHSWNSLPHDVVYIDSGQLGTYSKTDSAIWTKHPLKFNWEWEPLTGHGCSNQNDEVIGAVAYLSWLRVRYSTFMGGGLVASVFRWAVVWRSADRHTVNAPPSPGSPVDLV